MDIEQLAVERPDALAKVPVDPNVGIDDAKAKEIVEAAGFDEADRSKIVDVIKTLWTVYRDEDATLVEVNPLVKTEDGDIIALDGKVSLEDDVVRAHEVSAEPRHRPEEGHDEVVGGPLVERHGVTHLLDTAMVEHRDAVSHV